eukprot:SM000015S01233  [mRNA]  locus=s15:722606:726661:+ [translate_table: standard]
MPLRSGEGHGSGGSAAVNSDRPGSGGEEGLQPNSLSSEYWELPLPPERVYFVDSAAAFREVAEPALAGAAVLGLDAEWRPTTALQGSASRVSILQIACRPAGSGASGAVVLVLDMLALPPATFAGALGAALRAPAVPKLGFQFADDVRRLAASHPHADARGCFDIVAPYVDVGVLEERVAAASGRRAAPLAPGRGLAQVAEATLGLPLCKDLQCSDWEARPLSAAQLQYAAADAYCLLAIFDALAAKEATAGEAGDGPGGSIGDQKSSAPAPQWWRRPPLEPSERRRTTMGLTELLRDYEGLSSWKASDRPALDRGDAPVAVARAALAQLPGGSESEWWRLHAGSLSLRELNSRRRGNKVRKSSRATNRVIAGDDETEKSEGGGKQAASTGRGSGSGGDEDAGEWQGPPPWSRALGGDGRPRFLCDGMVEGLARQLRCVGIDAASPHRPATAAGADPARRLVEQAVDEGRVLLTRDLKLLRRRLLPPYLAYRVRALGKQDQLREVIAVFGLEIVPEKLLSRCTRCNGEFAPAPLDAAAAATAAPWTQVLPECVLRGDISEFWQCTRCRHLYWEGSQFDRALRQFASEFCQAADAGEGTAASGELQPQSSSLLDWQAVETAAPKPGSRSGAGRPRSAATAGSCVCRRTRPPKPACIAPP